MLGLQFGSTCGAGFGLTAARRWRRLIGVLMTAVTAGLLAAPATAGVLVVGDSISAAYGIDKRVGWVALFAERIQQSCPGLSVDNASVSGETTAGGLARLPALLTRFQPTVVVIELGGNDGLRGLSPQRMAANLRQMVALARAAGAQPVLLGMRIPLNFGQEYNRMFEAAFADVAASEDIPWVRFLLDGIGGQPKLMQADGLHPTVAAQPLLLENAWPVLAPVVEAACSNLASAR